MSEHEQVRKRANTYFFSKVVFNTILVVVGAFLIAFFLRRMQDQTAIYRQRNSSEQALNEVVEILETNEEDTEELTAIFHYGNQNMLGDLSELLTSGMFDFLSTATQEERVEVFDDIIGRSGIDYLLIIDEAGNVIISPTEEFIGKNIMENNMFTFRQVQRLIRGTYSEEEGVTPVYLRSTYGNYYFYSTPLQVQSQTVYLMLGAQANLLDIQIDSLKDVSEVLSRISVSNDGFLFAVNPENDTFLYYKNDGTILTGKSALEAGITKEALLDGYNGMQNILGEEYYCVTKKFNGTTLVCAVAETAQIFSNNKYVLFWSISGYILVMLLCLAYAIVVRNDFVRNTVETKKKVFKRRNGGETILNISIFQKVFPLMIFGVMIIFGISFYSQTLLEISESAEKSAIALEDVNARYQESQRNNAIIKDYYQQRFLSTAKLISYLIEEDPSVLNTPTERYYTKLGKDGEREYIYDSEGSILRSVEGAERLRELCANNFITSIYIFDENGRTIATNTEDWYFTLSLNPEDQSYPFQDIIDGRKDELIQSIMEDDTGAQSQYIGVAFNYYTTLDTNGNTVYLSRAQAEGLTRETFVNPVHTHRSLLQVEASKEMINRVLSATDASAILSSELLNGGSILLFDVDDAHTCLYSPNGAQIGKTAAEMGMSDNIFTGNDYYGFHRYNGERYFEYFHYTGDYFAGSAVPTRNMFATRFVVALITTLISLVLILFLSGTVTVTTKAEETLYETMSNAELENGLDSAIFNILLPSGRVAATTKAAARWDNRAIKWIEMSPEQKLLRMLSFVGGTLILYVIITVLGAGRLFGDGSIVRYILSGNWDRGFNIFALSACAIVLMFVSIVVALCHIPGRIFSSLLGARGETVSHLLLSVVKYGGTLGALFYCLYLLGVDAANLIASAGVLSLVIGFGAQSLVKDIISGLFIVFEGEFRVGDIITVNNYRGTVMDIGLRTTKVMAADGNIKIYNNSDISGVVNMTKETSIASITVGIEYGEDLEFVEEVLARELPNLAKKNPAILEGPQYGGVKELADNSVNLVISAKANEKDVYGVKVFLNREILRIFKENSINIPFANVTVSYLEKSPDRKKEQE